MSKNQLVKKIEQFHERELFMEEAKEKADNLRDELKQELLLRNTEELTAGQYIVRWPSVLAQRFDYTSFKKVMPDIYQVYFKQAASRRFAIA